MDYDDPASVRVTEGRRADPAEFEKVAARAQDGDMSIPELGVRDPRYPKTGEATVFASLTPEERRAFALDCAATLARAAAGDVGMALRELAASAPEVHASWVELGKETAAFAEELEALARHYSP